MAKEMQVLFKRVHPDAQLPIRNHGNRGVHPFEQARIDELNKILEVEQPDLYKQGGRYEHNVDATGLVIGTSDTGYDITCVQTTVIPAGDSAVVPTGIEVAYIPPGYWFSIAPRSGLGFKYGIQPHLGVIDNPYRGPLGVKLYNFSRADYTVNAGDRIAQIIFFPVISLGMNWSEGIIETERGAKGFGSSGK